MELWFDELIAQLEEIGPDDLRVPTDKINPDTDHILMEDIPYRLKCMYTLLIRYAHDFELKKVEARYAEDEEEKSTYAAHCAELSRKAETIKNIFFIEVNLCANAWNYDSIAIKEGWCVVACESPGPLQAFLNSIV